MAGRDFSAELFGNTGRDFTDELFGEVRKPANARQRPDTRRAPEPDFEPASGRSGRMPEPEPAPVYTPAPKGKYEDEWKRILGDQGSISAAPPPDPSIGSVARGFGNTFKVLQESGEQAIRDALGKPGYLTESQAKAGENRQLREVRQAIARQDTDRPQFDNPIYEGLYGAVESTIMQLPGIAGSVATGNIGPGLAWAGLTSGGQAYGKYRARGGTPGEAALGGIGEGAVEIGTELLPMGNFIKAFGKDGAETFLKQALKASAQDVPGEQIATLAQDAIDTAIANPEKTWDEYAAERPEAALVTLVATLGQGAIMTSGGYAIKKLDEKVSNRGTLAPSLREQAEEQAAASITQEDIDSPIDTADIISGRTEMAMNAASQEADTALGEFGMPTVGKSIVVTMPDGSTQNGTMKDVFRADDGAGVVVELEGGRSHRWYVDDMREVGISIAEDNGIGAQFDAAQANVSNALDEALGPMEAEEGRDLSNLLEPGVTEPFRSSPKVTPKTAPSSRPNPVEDGGAIVRSIFGDKARITSGYRGPNHPLSKKNPNSWHAKSRAAVDMAPIKGMTFEQAKAQIEAQGYTLLEAINEVGKGRTKHATGDHWHFVIGKGGQQGSDLAAQISDGTNFVPGPDKEEPTDDQAQADAARTAAQERDDAAVNALLNGDIAGEPVDAEWTRFKPESGTLDIPRAEMPQIKAENRGAMVNYLNARGIESVETQVPANSLKPTQAEFSPAKVQKAKDYEGGNRAILVSEDGHVVDGHHQWLAAREAGENIRVIRLGAPVREIINTVGDMPSTVTADGQDVPKVEGFADRVDMTLGNKADDTYTAADVGRLTKGLAETVAKTDARPDTQLTILDAIERGLIRDGDMLAMGNPRWALERGYADIGPVDGTRRGRITEAGKAKLAELRASQGGNVGESATPPTSPTVANAPIPKAPATTTESQADTAITPTGREIPVEYAVVDLTSLTTSHNQDGAVNPDFPAELQPRDRSRGASATQVAKIAANLDPRLLGKTPKAADGAPIVSASGIVESGNGRTLAIGRAYDLGGEQAAAYRQFVSEQGFDVTGIERPVLVRIRQGDMSMADVEAFTREANERDTASLSATEQAQADARAMPASVLSLYRGGDLDTAANRDFVRAFMGAVVTDGEQGKMIDADGAISQDAMRRIGAAMVQRAYGNPQLVAKLNESTDSNIKAIGGALSDVSTAWAEMVEAARNGTIDPAMDITENLNEAVALVDRARREGVKVADLVNQSDIFSGETVSPMTEAVLLMMFRNRAMTQPFGRAKLAEQLRWYVDQAMLTNADNLFGDAGRAQPGDVVAAARSRADGQQAGQQQALFGRPDEGNGSSVREDSQPRERNDGGELPRAKQKSKSQKPGVEPANIGDAMAARIAADFDAARAEYEAIDNIGGNSEGGRVLNTDIARELSPEYREDRSRATEVHEASSNFIKKLYAQKLREEPAEGLDREVLFTAGGAGAGKSSGMELVAAADDAGIVYDTTMDKLDSSISKIEQALDAGWTVRIMYVYREPLEALENGALVRADRMGRTVPINVLLNTHRGARKVIDELAARYKNETRVAIIAVDNSRGKDNAAIVPLADIPPLTDDKLSEAEAERIVQDAYDKGRISRATLGGTLEGRTRRSGPDPQGQEPGERPSVRGQPEQERQGTPRQGLTEPANQEAQAQETVSAPEPASQFANNKLFTQDKVDAARARMREKMNRLNSGMDPELMIDGMTIAGAYIESGIRNFAEFAKQMRSDFGNNITPYLLSFWEGARNYPGLNTDGMTSPDVTKAMHEMMLADDQATTAPEPATQAADETATDQRNGSTDRGGMGSPGEQEATGNGRPDGLPDGEVADSPLEAAQPADGGTVAETEPTGPAGVRPGRQDARAGENEPEGRNAADGREGTSGAGLASQGARGRNAGGVSRPDFHISDPAKIIGGTPKVRFANNQAAIEAYERVVDEGREPTKAELQAMAGYTGWGSFGQELFQGSWERPMPKDNWANESDWLRTHMGEENWKSAQASIINAHYTDPPTVQAMWSMVEKLGFKGGRVLEPSMGIGNFFSLMPKRLKDKSDLTGIEMDKMTGGMAKMLFPNSTIHVMPYQDSRTPDDFYDLVIGNWPFAADGPADRRYMKLAPSLHDFFFLKALDQTRPGGLVVGVTSSGTMDKVGRATRMELAKKADLVAAYRLPTGAFEEYAGTAVVTDILIFQKRETPRTDVSAAGWIDTNKMDAGFGNPPLNINEYWEAHPDAVLGKLGFGRSTQGRPGMMVTRPEDLRERLAALPKKLKKVYSPVERGNEPRFVTNNSTDRHGSVTLNDDGDLYQVQGERLVRFEDIAPRKLTAKDIAQAKGLVGLRKGYAGLIDAERDGAENVEDLRKTLNSDYQAFRKAHGPVTESGALKLFKKLEDPGAAILAALEKPDGSPSQILTQPMVRSARRLENPSVREAFVFERNKGMGIDLDAIAEQAGVSAEQAAQDLLDSRAIYQTPGGGYEVADVYLSGNVRQKLAEAKLAAEQGEDMAASIEALEGVIPENIPYYQIEAKLGATWVPGPVYERFIADLLNTSPEKISAKYAGGRWIVELKDRSLEGKSEAVAQWGTERIAFGSLLRHAFNNTSPKLQRKDDESNKMVLDEGASQAAAEKATLIREEFANWVFRDPLRRVDLERSYNEVMNAIATPQYDGSFLEFPGMVLEMYGGPLSLRKHQVDAIWQGLATGRGLFAHEVGTGKTLTIGGIAVEGRRFGIHRKPLVLAHNANSATVAAEINEMYPGAAVLYVDNLSPDTIDTTLRRIRNEDWDAVVMPHSVLDRLTLSRETLDALAADEIAVLEEEALKAAEDDNVKLTIEDMNDPDKMKKVRSVTAKNLVHARNRIIANIDKQALRASKDGAVLFEELGIDAIVVDEAHVFKKPPISTRMQLKGLNTATSNRSIALNFLTGYTKRNRNGQGVYLFTGTPITNTLTEIFNMQRYVMDDVMAKDGIDQWDAWFNTFADASSDVELNAAGEYEPVTRLASFVNVAELRRMAGQFLDIVFADDMPEFKPRETPSGKKITDPDLTEDERSNLVNGRAENPIGRPYKKIVNDVAPMGESQAGVMDILVARSKKFRAASKKDRRELMLNGDPSSPVIVETDASNASLDVRLYEEGAPDEPESKVNRAVENIVRHYREHKQASQVVFMERGFSDTATRKGEKVKRLNLAKDMTEKLVKQGIPRNEIAIVDGSTSKVKRKEIASKVKKAEIRVVIGSTATLGTGVNMQDNMRAMHHLDAPWMPGELEQRNGRGWRQGNHWNTVLEYRYITEKLDGRRWQVLSVKDRFIKAFLKADQSVRIIEGDAVETDEKVGADELAQTLADAAGDPRLLMINKLKNDVDKLERRERAHTYGVADAIETANNLEAEIAKTQAEMPAIEQDAAFVEKQRESGKFKAVVAGKSFTKRPEAEEAIAAEIKDLRGRALRYDAGPVPIEIEVNGFKLTAKKLRYGDLIYSLERTGSYPVRTESLRGMEATIRGVQAMPTEYASWIEEKQTSVQSLRSASKAPFAQAESLEKRRALLASIQQDIQDNPVPPPQWLRAGAPVNTEIYVRDGEALAKRVVEGHRWTNTDWMVSTDQGDVGYREALDSNGLPLYEEREFEAPVVDKTAQTVDAKQSIPEEGTATAPLDLDALQSRLEGYLGRKAALRVVETLGWAAGSYENRIIQIATNTPQDGTFTLDHEVIHALRDMGVFNQSEWAILAAKAKRDPYLMRSIKRRYAKLDAEGQVEEAVADLFAKWQRGDYAAKGTIERIFAKLRNMLEAVRNAFAGRGLRSAEGVMRDIDAGNIGRRGSQVGRGSRKDMVAFSGTFNEQELQRLREGVQVYHGGTLILGIGPNVRPYTPFFVTENPAMAEGYAKDRGKGSGRLVEFVVAPQAIATVRDVDRIAENVAGKDFYRIPTYALLDPAIEPEIAPKIVNELLKEGFDSVYFYDFGMDGDFQEEPAIAILDPMLLGTSRYANDIRYSIPERDDLVDLAGTGPTSKTAVADAFDRWRWTMQDRYLPLLRTISEIEKQTGQAIAPEDNPYIGEELMAGRIGTRLETLAEDHVRPLFDAMHSEGITLEELETYLYARHAPERNARIAEVNPEFTEGEGSGMSDVEAMAIMRRIEKAGRKDAFDRLAARVDAIRDMAVQQRVDSGLMSQKDADEWASTYEYYVPLRGFQEVEGDGVEDAARINRSGGGLTVKGPESKRAFGRRSRADSPLAYLIMQAEEAIVRGETNRVAQQFVKLAQENPDPEFWTVNKATAKRRENPETGLVEQYVTYNEVGEDKDWTVTAKFNGKQRRVTLNQRNAGARRLADAMRRLSEHEMDWVTQHLGKVNRFLSTVNTSYNPEFVITNAFRDLQTATFNLAGEEVDQLTRNTLRDYLKAMAAATKGAFGKGEGEWKRWYDEFRMNGGGVAFNKIENVSEIKKRIADLERMSAAKHGEGGMRIQAKRGIMAVGDYINNLNYGVENAVRLAAYKNARELGLSATAAASLAKNLTVNFNRRGTAGPALNSMYLFYNASVQGSVRLVTAMRSKRVRKIMMGVAGFAFALEILNAALSGDDDDGESFYDKIPAYEKGRNLIVMTGGSSYIKIPLPYGYNMFFNAGRSMAEIARRGGDRAMETMGHFVGDLADSFNPIGGNDSIMNLIAPTIADPIVDLTLNRDFTGRPIMPEQPPYEPAVPDNQRYWGSVGTHWRAITDTLNKLTGGDDVVPGVIDVSPETLEYMAGFVMGAAGATVDRTITAIGKGLDPAEEIERNDVPLFRKVVGDKAGWVDKTAYYDRLEQVDLQIRNTKDYLESGNVDAALDYVDRHEGVLSLEADAKQARKDMREVRAAKREIEAARDKGEISTAQFRDEQSIIREAEDLIITRFNSRWNEAIKAGK